MLKYLHGLGKAVATVNQDKEPGDILAADTEGDDKREIDQYAENIARQYVEDERDRYGFSVAIKGEDAHWGEDWYRDDGEIMPFDNLTEVDYPILIDQVEGTKNFPNSDRYTSLAALDPEDPTLSSITASYIYRWDDTAFFMDGQNAYQTTGNVDEAEELTAPAINEIDNTVKIRGQLIGRNIDDYATISQIMMDEFEPEEADWYSFKADGTSAGDILSTVTDNSVAIDLRALHDDRERLPYAQDFAPAAAIAEAAGATIVDAWNEPVDADFSRSGMVTTYVATPPGDIGDTIRNELLPEMREQIIDDA